MVTEVYAGVGNNISVGGVWEQATKSDEMLEENKDTCRLS